MSKFSKITHAIAAAASVGYAWVIAHPELINVVLGIVSKHPKTSASGAATVFLTALYHNSKGDNVPQN